MVFYTNFATLSSITFIPEFPDTHDQKKGGGRETEWVI